jgi:hypothetical protein
MKIILSQYVEVEKDSFPHHIDKNIESSIIPNIGMSIVDSVWKDPYDYKVIEVLINYAEDYCYVTLEKYSGIIKDNFKNDFANMVKLHGWNYK